MLNELIVSVPPTESKQPLNIIISGISYENPDYRINRPNSEIYTVEYIISGCGYVQCNDISSTVEAGDMYMLPPGANHLYYSDRDNPWQKIWINISGPLLSELTRLYGINGKFIFKNTNGYPYMKRMLDICKNKHMSGDAITKKIAPILIELIIFMSENTQISIAVSEEAKILKKYLDTHIEENITVKKLSEQIFRSESQTTRIFKKNFGRTPYDYLLENKIERAKILMKNTKLPIGEIAFRLGFSDEHYFSNIFKHKTGYCPTAFKKIRL